MPLVMKKVYNITGSYTSEELALYKELIDVFRLKMADDYPEKNLLNKKQYKYTDNEIIALINAAVDDINSGYPITKQSVVQIYSKLGYQMIIEGTMVQSLLREGLLQLGNQTDFNDSGLSIAMFNKSPQYQSYYGTLLQPYFQSKQSFKSSVIPSSSNAGFLGIDSEFLYARYRF